MKKVTIYLFISLLICHLANGQGFIKQRKDPNWMLSYGVGASAYDGDLQGVIGGNHSVRLGPSTLIGIRRKINSKLSMRMNLMFYQIFGDDRDNNGDNRPRNLNFRANNVELSVSGIYNLNKVPGSYQLNRPKFSPYILFGIGLSTNNPTTFLPNDEGNYSVNLWEYQTEAAAPVDGYPREVIVLPIGLGIRMKVHNNIDLLVEGTRRFTFTDYLDDVGGVFASRDEIIDWNGGEGSERANIAVQIYDRTAEGGFNRIAVGRRRGSASKDGYFIFSLSIEFYLQRKVY